MNTLQRSGLNKLGDVYAPGDQDFPAFSQLACAQKAPEMLRYLPAADRKDLLLLLSLLAFIPRFMIAWGVRLLELSPQWPDLLGGSLLRLMNMGLKGLVMTLYWSEQKNLDAIGFKIQVIKMNNQRPDRF